MSFAEPSPAFPEQTFSWGEEGAVWEQWGARGILGDYAQVTVKTFAGRMRRGHGLRDSEG